mgnify:CR=1 FL=1
MVRISALAIENVFYALSVALFISAGALALLLSFPLPKVLRYVSIGALGSDRGGRSRWGRWSFANNVRFISGALALPAIAVSRAS